MQPEIVEVTDKERNPEDYCMFNEPMAFCKICGTWLHCKTDIVDEYRRRPDGDSDSLLCGAESSIPMESSFVLSYKFGVFEPIVLNQHNYVTR